MENLEITPKETKERMKWVEPQVRQLDVSETSAASGKGGDGSKFYADCTRS